MFRTEPNAAFRTEESTRPDHRHPGISFLAADRYWGLFRDRVYSTPDRLSRAAVLRLVDREREAERERLAAATTNPALRTRRRMPPARRITA